MRDFDKRWPGSRDKYFGNFPKLLDTVHLLFDRLTFLDNQHLAVKYQKAQNHEEKNFIIAQLMTSFVPKIGKITKSWKPSLAEASKGFILRAQVTIKIDYPYIYNF